MISVYLVAAALFIMLALILFAHFRSKPYFPPVKESKVNQMAAKQQLAQLEQSYQSGDIEQELFELQKRDLLVKFASEKDEEQQQVQFARSTPSLVGLLVIIIVASVGLYILVGSWQQQALWDELKLIGDDQQALQQQILENEQLTEQQKAERLLLILRGKLLAEEDNANGWQVLGVTLARMGALDEAESAFERALNLEPSNHQIRLTWVQTLLETRQQENYRKALRHLNYILQLAPEHDSALMMKAFVHDWLGDQQQAISIWQHILDSRQPTEKLAGLLQENIKRAQKSMQQSEALIALELQLPDNFLAEYAGTTAFIALTSQQSPAPIAVKRLAITELSGPIMFSDQDSMAGQQISAFQTLNLVLRIQQGDKLGADGIKQRFQLGEIQVGSASVQLIDVK